MSEGFTMVHFMIMLFGMVGTVTAAIAAWFSADAANKSLVEQSENNKRALKPHLVLDSVQYDLLYDTNERFYKLNWDTGKYDLMDRITSKGPNISLVNISNGIAKEITVDLRIKNVDTAIEKLKVSMKEQDISFDFGSHPTFNRSRALRIHGVYKDKDKEYLVSERYRIDNFNPEEFLFIEAGGGKRQLKVPNLYLAIVNFLVGGPTSLGLSEIPKLIINVKYKDISDNCYENTYEMWAKIYSRKESRDEDIKVNIVFGIKEI